VTCIDVMSSNFSGGNENKSSFDTIVRRTTIRVCHLPRKKRECQKLQSDIRRSENKRKFNQTQFVPQSVRL